MVRQIIQLKLTRNQVKELIENGIVAASTGSEEPTQRQLIQLAKLIKSKDLPDAQSLASYLVTQDQNPHIARARIQTLRQLLDEAEKYLPE